MLFDYFLPGDCYHKVIEEYNFFDGIDSNFISLLLLLFSSVECFKTAFSRFLSLGIILGALAGTPITFNTFIEFFVVKVPQIIKILQSYSAEGLSYLASVLELAAATFAASYNYSKGFSFR